MTTAYKTIEDAIVALLTAGTDVADWIKGGDQRPMPRTGDNGAITTGVTVKVASSEMQPAEILGGQMLCNTTVLIELRRVGSDADDESAASAIDTLLTAVNGRIAADVTLSGAVMDLVLTTLDFDTDHGEKPTHTCRMTWQCVHQINRSTLA